MKISSLAISSICLLAASSEAFLSSQSSTLFAIRDHQSKTLFPTPVLHYRNEKVTPTSTTKNEYDTFTHLGLEYAPISLFGKGKSGVTGDLARTLLGGKGANLAEMSNIGLSVPPGFTITTECCKHYNGDWNQKIPSDLWNKILDSIKTIENDMNSKFGDRENPLLLSVRSGAAASMPGMMDTVLNLGMNDEVVQGLAKKSNNPRFAWDSYRRFLEMFGSVVLEIPRKLFDKEIERMKAEAGVVEDSDLTPEHLQILVERFKNVYKDMNYTFPEDVTEQLELAVGAVFRGWMGDRAVKYREVENIRNLMGTAVNIQAMVFGNMGNTSGTGVCFTRDPNTGKKVLFGEFLLNAQGEDVVAGNRNPKPISELETVMPHVYEEFKRNTAILEERYGDMQDIEFTIQEEKLFMLQTRSGKRCGEAAVQIAVDLVHEGLVEKEVAVMKVHPEHLDQLLHPRFPDTDSASYKNSIIAKGLPASPGAAVGHLAFTDEKVVENQKNGIPSIFVRDETSPDDVEGMHGAEGILTARGGMTSHAAVVARGWGRPCVCGCTAITLDEENGKMTVTLKDGSKKVFYEGDIISVNGSTGEVLEGEQIVSPPSITGNFKTFMDWVDECRECDVLANADTPEDAREARKNGANGIGLCRTEHMFFLPERIKQVRQLILGDEDQSDAALKELLQYQRSDFEGIFKEMDGLPVTIRLLDPPLHEFLPSLEDEEIISSLANQLGKTVHELKEQVMNAQEVNPMLGLRGCRLGITRPSIIEMQTRAIIEAALNSIEAGIDTKPDIMVPLVGKVEEFRDQAQLIRSVAEKVFVEKGKSCDFKIGTMIEIPRAALTAHEIAEEAEFFSFGSNDLTQMTFGYSRDDVGTFLPSYMKKGVLLDDPFVTIDTEGVGQLIQMTVERGRMVKPNLKIGVCGEHGGDPRSVRFFSNEAGLSYVSCSPFRVPIARLAAAQAAIETKMK